MVHGRRKDYDQWRFGYFKMNYVVPNSHRQKTAMFRKF